MSITEILEAHELTISEDYERVTCSCGSWTAEDSCFGQEEHRAHVARVLEQHVREQRAVTLERTALDVFDTGIPTYVARWLERRAKRIREAGEQ